MVLTSATAFGTLSILAKLAYRAGLGTQQTLAFRFVLAAIGMWGLALFLRQNPLRFRRRDLVTLIALGAVFYTAQSGYILLGERVMGSVPAVGASAVIVSGAAIAFCIIAAFTGELALPVTAQGWAVGFAIALIPTMVAISLFLAGLPRIGATRSSLLSTWEPVVTVLLAVVLLGDRLSLVQVLGGVLVLLAVGVVQSASLWKRSAPSAIK